MLFLVIGCFLMARLKCRTSHLTEVLRCPPYFAPAVGALQGPHGEHLTPTL